MFNKLINFKRSIIIDIEPVAKVEPIERSISLEEWLKEFNVGSKVVIDSNTEHAMQELERETKQKHKELVIKNSQKYCRLNHTTKTL